MKSKLFLILTLISATIFLVNLSTINVTNNLDVIGNPINKNNFISSTAVPKTLWKDNGIAICTENSFQISPQICCDESGVIIAWGDYRNIIDYNIYAQKLTPAGRTLWDDNGTIICTAEFLQDQLQICCDGNGGAIIVWQDARNVGNNDIYAQHINSNGEILWDVNGTVICNDTSYQNNPVICCDGSGSAIIAWIDQRDASSDIYAQKINASGVQWTENGIVICNATDIQGSLVMCCNDSGDAIFAWKDNRDGDYDIYAQKVDSEGNTLWKDNGIALCNASDIQDNCQIACDGTGGAIVTWRDRRNGTYYDIYAQRVDSNGIYHWGDNGTVICNASYHKYSPDICFDGAERWIITWTDNRKVADSDIYAQKVNLAGTILWDNNGNVVCNATANQYNPKICCDGQKGAFIIFRDERPEVLKGLEKGHIMISLGDIYGQYINSDGTVRFGFDGIVICTAGMFADDHQICCDGRGNVYMSWHDDRTTDYNIYAQKMGSPKGGALVLMALFLLEEEGSNLIYGVLILVIVGVAIGAIYLFMRQRE